MAYMSQAASPRSSPKPSPRKQTLEEGPIKELVQVIDDTRPEQWQQRTAALVELVAQIPTGNEYSRRESWFNSPPTLRHLHQPIGELLKDPRSTVVKRTCECLNQLFAICQGDAKYLFKDLMPVVLQVHAQTVQVIRSQVQSMVADAIPVVPCKMAMPLWLDRLKTDKSRTVREACVLYLGMGLQHWNIENPDNGNPYLTTENWVQIGTALIKVLRDPSPTVRSYTKQGLSTIREAVPELWDDLIRDPNGPAGKDMKLQKWLIKVSEEGLVESPHNEELSVASRYSVRSYASANKPPSTPQHNRVGSGGGFTANRSSSRGRGPNVPVSISVGGKPDKSHAPPRQRQGLGPPLRRPFAQAMEDSSNPNSYPIPQLGTPPRHPPTGRKIQQRSPSPSPRRPEPRHQVPLRSRSASSASIPSANRAKPTPEAFNGTIIHSNNSNVSPDDVTSLPVIDLVDGEPSPKKPSPPEQIPLQHQQQDPPPQQTIIGVTATATAAYHTSSGVYSHASSTEMLDVTKRIDQTLAHLQQPNHFLSQVQEGQQATTEPLSPPHQAPTPQPEDEAAEEGPFIASMNELKQHASRRRSRRSIHMKERWSRGESIGRDLGITPLATTVPGPTTPADAVSSLGASMYNHPEDASKPLPAPSALPEHYIIAEQLLRVHKTHVDQIMETLKIEMDTLRDFEQSLEQEQSPSPDQVLDYFESVGLCLDQRTTAGNILQREMDRISKGAFKTTITGGTNNPNNNNPNNNSGR